MLFILRLPTPRATLVIYIIIDFNEHASSANIDAGDLISSLFDFGGVGEYNDDGFVETSALTLMQGEFHFETT